jgi:hypothetical protein
MPQPLPLLQPGPSRPHRAGVRSFPQRSSPAPRARQTDDSQCGTWPTGGTPLTSSNAAPAHSLPALPRRPAPALLPRRSVDAIILDHPHLANLALGDILRPVRWWRVVSPATGPRLHHKLLLRVLSGPNRRGADILGRHCCTRAHGRIRPGHAIRTAFITTQALRTALSRSIRRAKNDGSAHLLPQNRANWSRCAFQIYRSGTVSSQRRRFDW